MARLLKGKEVAASIIESSRKRSEDLKEAGVFPTLAILRVGERADDISYEKGAVKRCGEAGVDVRRVVLDENAGKEEFYRKLDELNRDDSVHGILMFRPLPKYLDNDRARESIVPEKDVDGCTGGSLEGVFTGSEKGFAPCTAQAAMEILKYYGIPLQGKRAVVIGRSLVVGRPLAMMLLEKNATVTICHSKSEDIPSITKEANIVIAATGRMESLGKEYFLEGQSVIDVGISWNDAKGKLCGDVRFDEAELVVENITPVPGGVGSVTTAVLISHVVEAAERAYHKKEKTFVQ